MVVFPWGLRRYYFFIGQHSVIMKSTEMVGLFASTGGNNKFKIPSVFVTTVLKGKMNEKID